MPKIRTLYNHSSNSISKLVPKVEIASVDLIFFCGGDSCGVRTQSNLNNVPGTAVPSGGIDKITTAASSGRVDNDCIRHYKQS